MTQLPAKMTISERLREKRGDGVGANDARARLTQGAIGKRLEPPIQQSTVSSYEREPEKLLPYGPSFARQFFAAYGFEQNEVDDLVRELFAEHVRALGVGRTETAIVVGAGVAINVYAAGTGPAWGDTDVLERFEVPGLPKADAEYIGLKATGHSMEPYLRRGDTAIVLRDEGAVRPGDYCAVWLADDGCVVKRFVQELDDGTLILESLNPERAEERVFRAPLGSRILGPVVKRLLNG